MARDYRRFIIAVLGSGTDEHRAQVEPLGRWIAEQGFDLLTGGGGGVMRAVAEAFVAVPGRRGISIGIIPGIVHEDGSYETKPGYPNEFIELPICTHLPLSGERGIEPMSRNHVNVLSADVLVALPGGPGTISELVLAVRYRKPVIAFGPAAALPPDLRVERTDSLARVCEFILSRLGNPRLPEIARPPTIVG